MFNDIGILSIEIDVPTVDTFEFRFFFFEKSKASSKIASMCGLWLGLMLLTSKSQIQMDLISCLSTEKMKNNCWNEVPPPPYCLKCDIYSTNISSMHLDRKCPGFTIDKWRITVILLWKIIIHRDGNNNSPITWICQDLRMVIHTSVNSLSNRKFHMMLLNL